MIKKILGYTLFFIFNKINFRLLNDPLGRISEKCRVASLRIIGAKIADNAYIRAYAYICFPSNLSIGNNSKTNSHSKLFLFDKLPLGTM